MLILSVARLHNEADAPAREWPRMAFQEAMAMTPLPPAAGVKSFISRQPAWKPGAQLPWDALFRNLDGPRPSFIGAGAYGGHVYAQAALAAARVVEDEDGAKVESGGKLGIHVSKARLSAAEATA